MEYESIEQEVKAENLRKHEREEAAANREHELKMAKLNKKGFDGDNVAFGGVMIAVVVILATSGIAYNLGSHAGEVSRVLAEASCGYEKIQSHAAGVQAGLSQGRNECKEGEGR